MPGASTVAFEPLSGKTWRDPYPMYEALRRDDPLHHVASGDYWVLSRFIDVWNAARDHATFSSNGGLTITYGERERIGLDEAVPLVMLDPPQHTALRRLVSGGFTPRRVSAIEPMVRSFVRRRLDRVADLGTCDIVAELFKPLPSMVVAHYLGVPAEDRSRFDRWTEAIVEANAAGDVALAAGGVTELFEYFTELIQRRTREPGHDMISALIHAGADAPSTLRILGLAFTMVAGGNDTATGMLGGAATLLSNDPAQREMLRSDRGLLPGAVEEVLRLACPVQGLARTTTRSVELHGRTIPMGRKVLLLYASANRDAAEFGPSADQFDITRAIPRMMTFGYGAHHCLGAAAARLQGRVALDELLTRFPRFAVDESRASYAEGNYVRRFQVLPFVTDAG